MGISRKIEKDEQAHTRIGTPRYLAPEVYRGDAYSFSADIWSLGLFELFDNERVFTYRVGIMLVELVKLKAPIIVPHQQTENCLCMPVATSWVVPVPQFSNNDYGTQLFRMAKQMLKYKPRKRPSAAKLEKFLRLQPVTHPEYD